MQVFLHGFLCPKTFQLVGGKKTLPLPTTLPLKIQTNPPFMSYLALLFSVRNLSTSGKTLLLSTLMYKP